MAKKRLKIDDKKGEKCSILLFYSLTFSILSKQYHLTRTTTSLREAFLHPRSEHIVTVFLDKAVMHTQSVGCLQ